MSAVNGTEPPLASSSTPDSTEIVTSPSACAMLPIPKKTVSISKADKNIEKCFFKLISSLWFQHKL
jgi:hypothetical protein